MSIIVSLKEVADTLEMLSETTEAYLVRETGEILVVNEDDHLALEDSDDTEMPEWQRDHIARLREILDTDRVVELPSSYDIDAWSIMEQFCYAMADAKLRDQLLDSIHGRGAFRMFRSTCERLGLLEDWYAFRREAIETIAREWLESSDIPFK